MTIAGATSRPDALLQSLLLKVGLFGTAYLGVLGILQGKLLVQKARQILALLRATPDSDPAP